MKTARRVVPPRRFLYHGGMISRMHRIVATIAMMLMAIGFSPTANAAVTITFWSQEFGSSFPHAFFTLSGTPEAGGAPVDLSYGFTAKAVTPAILLGTVPGRIDLPTRGYIGNSNAHFSTVLTDAQYARVLALVREWGEEGDHRYNFNRRNCVHFVAEAARRSGLTVVEEKRLMKKPRSFTQSMAAMNAGAVAVIELPAKEYYASLTAPAAGARLDAAPAIDAPAVAVPAR